MIKQLGILDMPDPVVKNWKRVIVCDYWFCTSLPSFISSNTFDVLWTLIAIKHELIYTKNYYYPWAMYLLLKNEHYPTL